MKKKKLNLNKLKVESFVTSMEEGKEETAKGGFQPISLPLPGCGPLTLPPGCNIITRFGPGCGITQPPRCFPITQNPIDCFITQVGPGCGTGFPPFC